jgi:hypothetical protein
LNIAAQLANGTSVSFTGTISTVADGNWHYGCFDMFNLFKQTHGATYSSYEVTVTNVSVFAEDKKKHKRQSHKLKSK